MHVLTVTPHNRLEPETIRALFSQSYAGSLSHVFMRDNPEPVIGHNIIRAYKRLREIFLSGNYDVLWIVENDVIPPPSALEKMLAVPADIVYGVYLFRRGKPVVNIVHARTGNPITESPQAWAASITTGAVIDCGGKGFGCTLIRRHVLEALEFRSEGGGGDADSCLAVDAPKAGFTQRAHFGVLCGHKRPDGVTLWPIARRPFYEEYGVSTPKTTGVKALRSFAYWPVNGATLIVAEGERVDIDFEIASSLVSSGQAEYS